MRLNDESFYLENDEDLKFLLIKYCFKPQGRPFRIIQSGSQTDIPKMISKILAEPEQAKFELPQFYRMCDPSWIKVQEAKEALKDYPFIEVYHSLSVALDRARYWLRADQRLRLPERFDDDIRIDTLEDPMKFYMTEVEGKLFGDTRFPDENFMRSCLPIRRRRILFILGGPGGIGWCEFRTTEKLMRDQRPYWVLARDIDHIKHVRTLEYALENPKWRVIGMREGAWALLWYNPERKLQQPKSSIMVYPRAFNG